MWKKLQVLEKRPEIAVAYHSRLHSFTDRSEYVLVQGRATLWPLEDSTWLEQHRQAWERFAGPRRVGPMWEAWLSVYHWRVGIEIDVERILVWPDLSCRGPLQTWGSPLPSESALAQSPPKRGTGPRVDHARAAKRARKLPHVLLGWAGADGYPLIVPVEVAGTERAGVRLVDHSGLLPAGGRRAGLLAHTFARYTYGQNQRKHTGWLEFGLDDFAVYAPHTESGYYLPASRFLYRLSAGIATRRGLRAARKAGFVRG